MKIETSFSILLLIGFASVALFGVFGMETIMKNHGGCAAAVTQGINCMGNNNPIDYFFLHLDFFKKTLNAIFNDAAILLLAAVLLFAIAKIAARILLKNPVKTAFSLFRLQQVYLKTIPRFRHKFIHWLSLRENSPSTA